MAPHRDDPPIFLYASSGLPAGVSINTNACLLSDFLVSKEGIPSEHGSSVGGSLNPPSWTATGLPPGLRINGGGDL